MLTPKKDCSGRDFLSEESPHSHGDLAGVWSKKPLSQTLREARERKNMSRQEVAKLTHIPLNYLQLLEGEGDERGAPDSLYLIASLRSYVAFLDIDAGGALTQFITELERRPSVQENAGGGRRLTHFPQPWPRGLPRTLLLLLTLGLLPFVGYYGVRAWMQRANIDQGASLPPPSTTVPQSGTLLPPSSPAPSASLPEADHSQPSTLPPVEAPPVAAVPPAKPLSSAPHHLRIQATARTWLHVTVDDQPMKRLFLRPGQSLEWSAEQGFTLSLGNAGAVKVTLDGQDLPPVGKAGQMALNVRLPSRRGSQEREVRNTARPQATKPR